MRFSLPYKHAIKESSRLFLGTEQICPEYTTHTVISHYGELLGHSNEASS